MKTSANKRFGHTLARGILSTLAGLAVAGTAFLFPHSELRAATTVTTLTQIPYFTYPSYFGYADGDIAFSEFHTPVGVTVDNTGNYLFVADRDNNAIRFLEFDTGLTWTFGIVQTNLVNKPVGVAINRFYNVFVLNRGNGNNGTVVQFNSFGETVATNATALTNAAGIVLDPADNMYVTAGNTVYRITPAGVKSVVATITAPGAVLQGIARKPNGMLAVCDSGRNGIYQINPNTGVVTTNAGFHGAGDFATNAAYLMSSNTAKFNMPMGIAVAGDGSLIVADYGNHRVKIVRSSDGAVTNLYGVNSSYWYGPLDPVNVVFPGWWDGTTTNRDMLGTVEARLPMGVAIAPNGNVYTSEEYYNLLRVTSGAGLVAPPPLPPLPPEDLVATAIPGRVTLSWSPSIGATNYNVKRSPSSGGPYAIVGSTASTSLSDSNVVDGNTYYYVVTALNTGGESANSSEASVTVPLRPVASPQIGYVTFPPPDFTSVFNPVSAAGFVFNNDVPIVIIGEAGTQTFYNYANTNNVNSVPDPTPSSSSAPVGYVNGLFSVSGLTVASVLPYVAIKAMGAAPGRSNSPVVSSLLQFVVGNPLLVGNNAALFSVTNITVGARMYYTTDGTDPSPTNSTAVGPIFSGASLSLQFPPGASNLTFKIRGFKDNYQPSGIVSNLFSSENFIANQISFGFEGGEASSEFVGSAGQTFYAPVTLSLLPGALMYSLQFNLAVTNVPPAPPVTPGAVSFSSTLLKPNPDDPTIFLTIPPATFLSTNYPGDPPPTNQIFPYLTSYSYIGYFLDNVFTNTTLNLLGVGWLERRGFKNLYDTTQQDLIRFSQPHDTLFNSGAGKVVVGGYAFTIPPFATNGQKYQIQIGRPSATSDGVGAPGSDVFIATPTNGSLALGALNAIKQVTVGQRKYVVGDVYPFRWFNAGDFGKSDTNHFILSADVLQVFQSAIYHWNEPLPGSDFRDAMDSCCGAVDVSTNGPYFYPNSVTNFLAGTNQNPLYFGDDTMINSIAFGDGELDVTDVYVTFRRSLDPCLQWFQRYWTNGLRAADTDFPNNFRGGPDCPPIGNVQAQSVSSVSPSVAFSAGDMVGAAGQTVQIPITARIQGSYPIRVLALNLTVEPLDGSPAVNGVQFSSVFGPPTIADARGGANYAAAWLTKSASLSGSNVPVGTLTFTIPSGAGTNAAYAITFDHVSASPNGLAPFPVKAFTGLATRSDRSASSWNDGIPDSWRLRYFGSINNILSAADADADGDGLTTRQEYLAGTNPNNAASHLKLSGGKNGSSPELVIRWPTAPNKQYIIERASSIYGPTWTPVSTNSGTGFEMEYRDSSPGGNKFYRVRLAP